jgi:prephenate dehydrogenase
MGPEPPFRSVAIVGLGLIGGSLALATRERWPSVRVTGVDTESVIAHVRGSGAIDRSAASVGEVGDVDLIVLAAPVQQNLGLLSRLPAGSAVVTDVGSTKRVMVEAGRQLVAPSVFVGGHPLGGAERGGFAYARADLFEGRPWILTPDEGTPASAVDMLTRFVSGLGANAVLMTADAHDSLMAFISHLPQLTASALMDVVGERAGAEGLRLAGRGLIDTTRLASSPANVWRDVCQTNADAIGQALDLLIARLTDLRAHLNGSEAIDELFDDSARWRSVLLKGQE